MEFTAEELEKMRNEAPCQHCTKRFGCAEKRERDADNEPIVDCEEFDEEEVM